MLKSVQIEVAVACPIHRGCAKAAISRRIDRTD
jgi:hypothetical protein